MKTSLIKYSVIWPELYASKDPMHFVFYCKKCGAHVQGKAHGGRWKVYKDACNTAICPVCGNELEAVDGYFAPAIMGPEADEFIKASFFPDFPESESRYIVLSALYNKNWFELLKKRREVVEHDKAKKMVEAFLESCDLPAPPSTVDSLRIKESPEKLKEYILYLIQTENNIYSLGRHLNELYYQRMGYNRDVVLSVYEPAYKVKSELEKLRSKYQNAVKKISNAKAYQPQVYVEYPQRPTMPTFAVPGLFNKKKVKKANDALMAQYRADLEEYHKEVQKCDDEKARLIEEKRAEHISEVQKKLDAAKIALESAESDADRKIKELEERPVPARAIKEILDEEIREAEELLKKTFAARNELYAYGIIFGKYRNAVALSSIYEYLMSGRCASLEGADGAYNIYENEIRANCVIAQLDTVISSLEDIKQNQYMMYQELRSINSALQTLIDTMDEALSSIRAIKANTTQMNEYMEHISQNSNVIAHNTAVTAYYSKVNAELTNALGYMVAF